jgi:hypothetical protein
MIQRKSEGERNRISVSLDDTDYEWVESLCRPGNSMSYTLSRVIKEARQSGVTLFENSQNGLLGELKDWLAEKEQNNFRRQLHQTLKEFFDR